MTGRGSYHHGDLRDALVAAGLRLLDDEGEHAVTLRAVARLTGVSHSAPSHHFGDRDGLIEALSHEVARALGADLRQSTRSGEDYAGAAQQIGVAYVRWAVLHPHRFRLLSSFRPTIPVDAEELLDASATQSTQNPRVWDEEGQSRAWEGFGSSVLVEAFVRGQAAGVIAPGDPQVLAMTGWATVHGLATLLLDGLLTEAPPTVADAERLSTMVSVVLGLGVLRR